MWNMSHQGRIQHCITHGFPPRLVVEHNDTYDTPGGLMQTETACVHTRRLMKTVTINRPAVRVYQAWRDLAGRQTIPILDTYHIASAVIPNTIKAPSICATGAATTNMAELTLDIPGTIIAWKSLPGTTVEQAGEVWFSPLPQNRAEVRVILTWQDGVNGAHLPTAPGQRAPAALVERELLRFKHLIEG